MPKPSKISDIDAILDAALATQAPEGEDQDIDAILDAALATQALVGQAPSLAPLQQAPSQGFSAQAPRLPSVEPVGGISRVTPSVGTPPKEEKGLIDDVIEGVSRFPSRIVPKYQEEIESAKKRFAKPESNIIDKIIGSLQYAGAPFSAITGPLAGEPVSRGLQRAGVPEPIAGIGGLVAELAVPTGTGLVTSSAKVLKTKDILKTAYGVNSLDPSLNAEAVALLKAQKKTLSPWEKYIGPKYDTAASKIAEQLKRVGIAENLSPQQQTIKQLKIKLRQSKGDIENTFNTLAERAEGLSVEEQVLFSQKLSTPDTPTGVEKVDSLIQDIHSTIEETTKGTPVYKEIQKQVQIHTAKDEIPLYHGSKAYKQGDLIKSVDGDLGPGIYFGDSPRASNLEGAEVLGISEEDTGSKIIPVFFKGRTIGSRDEEEYLAIAKKYSIDVTDLPKTLYGYHVFVRDVNRKFNPIAETESAQKSKSRQIANDLLEREGIDAIVGSYAGDHQYAILNPKSIRYLDQPIFETQKENALSDLADEIPSLLGIRGITKTIDKDELSVYEDYGFKLAPGNIPKSKQIKINRKFTSDELGQLTELDDSGNYIANIGRSLANDVSILQYYDDINKHFSASNYVKGPGTRKISERKIRGSNIYRKGTLSGKYIPNDLADDIEFVDSFRSNYANTPIIKQYLKANQAWKLLRTAWNPKVQAANVISSAINYDLTGARKGAVVTGIKEIYRKGPLYSLGKKYGLFTGGFVRTESEGFAKEALDVFIDTIRRKEDLTNDGAIRTAINIANKGTKLGVRVNSEVLNFYNLGDDIFKFGIFIDRLEKGYAPVDAAKDARTLGIDYDINAPIISILRDTTHPFIGYLYRIIPRLIESATKNPVRFGKWAILGYALQQTLTEDEKRTIELLPERQKGTAFGIPGAPSTLIKAGKNKVVNVAKIIPGGNIFEPSESGFPLESLKPSGGLAGSVVSPFVRAQDQFGEPLLESPTSTFGKLGARTKSFLESNVPNIPGVPYAPATKQFRQALSGKYSEFQDPKSISDVILGTFGIDIINLDRNRSIKIQEVELKESLTMVGKMEHRLKQNFEKELLSEEDFRIEQLKLNNEKILLKAEFREKVR